MGRRDREMSTTGALASGAREGGVLSTEGRHIGG